MGNGRIDVFATGLDGTIWHRFLTGGVWWPWYTLGGAFTSGPGAVSMSLNRVDVFGRGLDGSLWGRSLSGSIWGNWYTLGGLMASAPDVSSWVAEARRVRHSVTDGAWAPDVLGRGLVPLGVPRWPVHSGPGASWGSNRIDVVSRGDRRRHVDELVDRPAGRAGTHSGGAPSSAPDVAAPGVNKLTASARGGDGFIWLKSLTASGWTGWYIFG